MQQGERPETTLLDWSCFPPPQRQFTNPLLIAEFRVGTHWEIQGWPSANRNEVVDDYQVGNGVAGVLGCASIAHAQGVIIEDNATVIEQAPMGQWWCGMAIPGRRLWLDHAAGRL